jgi:hypothetical protein
MPFSPYRQPCELQLLASHGAAEARGQEKVNLIHIVIP